jgi:hypothetical protein
MPRSPACARRRGFLGLESLTDEQLEGLAALQPYATAVVVDDDGCAWGRRRRWTYLALGVDNIMRSTFGADIRVRDSRRAITSVRDIEEVEALTETAAVGDEDVAVPILVEDSFFPDLINQFRGRIRTDPVVKGEVLAKLRELCEGNNTMLLYPASFHEEYAGAIGIFKKSAIVTVRRVMKPAAPLRFALPLLAL